MLCICVNNASFARCHLVLMTVQMISSTPSQEVSTGSVVKAKKERTKNVSKSATAHEGTSKIVAIEAFTPSVLNNHIVKMRKIVKAAQQRMMQKMKRQIKDLSSKVQKKADPNISKTIDKLTSDLKVIKIVMKDEVSKFALVNKESLSKLLNKPNVSSSERVFFKLATCPAVESNVKAFRLSHPGCETSCAFMLQRLGLQYQAIRAEKDGDKLKKKLKSGETIDVHMDSDESDGGKTNEDLQEKKTKKKVTKSTIERVLTKTIEKAKKEEKQTAVNKNKRGEKIPEAPVEVKPIEIVKAASKEAVVKKLSLLGRNSDDEESEDDDEVEAGSEDEEETKSEGEEESDEIDEKEEMEESDGDEATEDGLSAFFLNADGSSRTVVASEMRDVEDEDEDEKRRGAMRGRGNRRMMRGSNRGRGGISDRMKNSNRDMNGRIGKGDRGGRVERRGDRGRRGGETGGRGRGTGGNRGASLPSLPAPSSSSTDKLHPSWIAKQKEKEMMKAAPSGKKIIFD